MAQRTVDDWLRSAASASDSEAAAGALDAACAAAVDAHEWRSILAAAAEHALVAPERLAEIATRTLRAAEVGREVWGFRDVATARADKLGDLDGARAALAAGETTLHAPASWLGRARAYEWVILGHGYRVALADADGFRRCLVQGRALALTQDDADDLCSIGVEWALHVDRTEGEQLLRDVGSARPWSLANAWHALGDAAAARDVLDAALASATTAEAALHVAKACASHQRPEAARAAIERALALAEPADCLECAEVAFDAGAGDDLIRVALELALAGDAPRDRIAAAYADWLHDEAAAERVGPRGVRPDALRDAPDSVFSASASELLDWLRARLTAEQLQRIARADYGQDAAKHLAVLESIARTGVVPRTLDWVPHEVLALSRWAEGEQVDHVERAFCCVLLCLVPSGLDELLTNGVILLDSCLALGSECAPGAESFFAWLAATEVYEKDVARLLLLLVQSARAPHDPRLDALRSALLEDSATLAASLADCMRTALWLELASRLLAPHAESAPLLAALLPG